MLSVGSEVPSKQELLAVAPGSADSKSEMKGKSFQMKGQFQNPVGVGLFSMLAEGFNYFSSFRDPH